MAGQQQQADGQSEAGNCAWCWQLCMAVANRQFGAASNQLPQFILCDMKLGTYLYWLMDLTKPITDA